MVKDAIFFINDDKTLSNKFYPFTEVYKNPNKFCGKTGFFTISLTVFDDYRRIYTK